MLENILTVSCIGLQGVCETPPPSNMQSQTGQCEIDFGAYTITKKLIISETGIADPVDDFVQLYFDSLILNGTSVQWFFPYTTLWLMGTTVTGPSEIRVSDGSAYIISTLLKNTIRTKTVRVLRADYWSCQHGRSGLNRIRTPRRSCWRATFAFFLFDGRLFSKTHASSCVFLSRTGTTLVLQTRVSNTGNRALRLQNLVMNRVAQLYVRTMISCSNSLIR